MFDQLKAIICKYVEVEEGSITPESRFVEDLGFNSYDFMCLVGDIEDTFDVEVQEREAMKIRTVGDAVAYIESLQA